MKKIILILLIILSFLTRSCAQSFSPGGISNDLTLWLDGSNGVNLGVASAINGGSIDTWINKKINLGCIDLNQTLAGKMPTYRTNALNFNSIVEFDGINDQLDRSILGSDIFNASNNTILFVHKHSGGTVYFKWEQGSGGNRVGFENSGGFTRFDFPTDAANNQTIGTFPFHPIGQIVTATTNNSTSTLRNMGLQNISNPTTGTLNTSFTSDLSIGENVWFSVPSQIDFAEIIVYKNALSAIEMNRIESYLAIKYGMTLGINGTSLDYNSSGGNVIWDAGNNTGYNFDIAGISRDDLTDQDQRKSKSVNQSGGIDNDILTLANSTNISNPLAFGTDMSHLIWGHNNGPKSLSNTTTFLTTNPTPINTVLDRHWKIQETGAVGTTTLHFDFTNVTGFTYWNDLRLLVDDDGNFTTGATSFVPSFIDSTGAFTIEFEHDFSAIEGFYFTLGALSILSIDNPLPVVSCDTFTLLPITGNNLINPQYYSAPNGPAGTGVIIPIGTIISANSTIYLYDQTGGTPNQFDEDTLNITINISPVVIVPTGTSYCHGDVVPASVYTSLPSGATYEWFHTNPAIGLANTTLIAGNTPSFTATNISLFPDTSIISVIPTLNNCPGDTANYFITVNPIPAAPTADSVLVCINHTATLTATAPGPVYEWFDAVIGGNLLFTGASYTTSALAIDTSYWVQSTINNCTGPRTRVYVTIGAALAVNAGSDIDICAGQVANLSATPNTAGNKYTWSEPGIVIIDTFVNQAVMPLDTTIYTIEIRDLFGCVGTANVTVNVKPTPVVTVPIDSIFCNGDAVPVSAYTSIPIGATYEWSHPNTAIGLTTLMGSSAAGTPNTPGFTATNSTVQPITDTITVIPTYLSCIGNPVDYTITVNPIPTLFPTSGETPCAGETVDSSQIIGSPIGMTFNWTNSNPAIGLASNGQQDVPSFVATNTSHVSIAGLITLTPQANNCTGNPINYNITVSAPITIDKDPLRMPRCFGSNDGEIKINPSGGTPSYTYSWTSGQTTLIASNLSPGPVTVIVTDVNGCWQDSTFYIVEPDSIDYISFYATPRSGCSPLEVQFNSTIDPAQHLLQNYIWNFGNNLVPQDTFIAHSIYETPGTYNVSLTVTDLSGCSNTLTLNDFITVHEDPEAHFSTSPETITEFNPTVDFNDESYPNIVGWKWYFDSLGNSNYENPNFTFPEDSGTYYVTLVVEDDNTCTDTLTKKIFIKSEIALFLPNSFTPNGDGLNDTFTPNGFGISEEGYTFLIFNRWGELVFETNSVLEGWNGTFKDKTLPSGVYIWRVDFNDLNGKEYRRKGQLNILR